MKKIRPINGKYWYLGQAVRGKRAMTYTFKSCLYDIVVPCRKATEYMKVLFKEETRNDG